MLPLSSTDKTDKVTALPRSGTTPNITAGSGPGVGPSEAVVPAAVGGSSIRRARRPHGSDGPVRRSSRLKRSTAKSSPSSPVSTLSVAEAKQTTETGLSSEIKKLTRTSSFAPDIARRASPIVANGRHLRDDALCVIRGKIKHQPVNLLATTYGVKKRDKYTPLQSTIGNLRLDMNMHWEEEFQRQLEHDPYFLKAVKTIVGVIHDKLQLKSTAALQKSGQPFELTEGAKSQRIAYIREKLFDYYPSDALVDFFSEVEWSRDEHFKPFLDNFREDRVFGLREKQEAHGLLKLLKMLDTQFGYFGGSIEYDQHINESLEFWIYHLSTLTKDPERQYSLSDSTARQLSKPLKDYRTAKSGLVPFMNQKNLGTGVSEALWEQLPLNTRREITDGVSRFLEHVSERSDRRGWAAALDAKYQRAADTAAARIHKSAEDIQIHEVWNHCTEDDRKIIFGDICRIPWSDAHLIEGGQDFHDRFSAAEAGDEGERRLLGYQGVETIGLKNVAGIHGNILETPVVAAGKYLQAEELEKLRVQNKFEKLGLDAPTQETIREEFVTKHTDWYKNAMKSHKPIVGGMSGHTLGYLNLYEEALGKVSEQDRAELPTLETLRGIMLAALTGMKRHHSVDEVYTASTAVRMLGQSAVSYADREGYGDAFGSSDSHIRRAAYQAKIMTAEKYVSEEEITVLNVIKQEVSRASSLHSRQPVTAGSIETIYSDKLLGSTKRGFADIESDLEAGQVDAFASSSPEVQGAAKRAKTLTKGYSRETSPTVLHALSEKTHDSKVNRALSDAVNAYIDSMDSSDKALRDARKLGIEAAVRDALAVTGK